MTTGSCDPVSRRLPRQHIPTTSLLSFSSLCTFSLTSYVSSGEACAPCVPNRSSPKKFTNPIFPEICEPSVPNRSLSQEFVHCGSQISLCAWETCAPCVPNPSSLNKFVHFEFQVPVSSWELVHNLKYRRPDALGEAHAHGRQILTL